MIRWISLQIAGGLECRYLSTGVSTELLRTTELSRFSQEHSLDSLVAPSLSEGMLWVDLIAPSRDEIESIGRKFQLHPLAVEDCLHADQRPKVEDYAAHLFVVLHSFETPEPTSLKSLGHPEFNATIEENIRELHLFLQPGVIITVHDGTIEAIETLFQKCSQDRNHLTQSTDFLMQKILEEVVEGQPRYLEYLDDEIQRLDEEVLQEKDPGRSLEKVHSLQNRLNFVRRVLVPQREVFQKLYADHFSQISKEALPWFRDLLDHALRIQSELEELRENLWTIREAHLAIAAHRTNEAMRRLTIFSVVFLPLTFITGFFGMNFQTIPYHRHEILLGTVLLVLTLPILMLIWFSKKRWL